MKKCVMIWMLALVMAFGTVPCAAAGQAAGTASFTDVPQDAWYADEVALTVELGLVNGRGGGIYDPAGNVTVAETIKLAVAAYQSFFEEARLENGRERWYDTYVAYAKEKAIISRDYDYTAVATRAQVAEILAGLPDDILYEMCFVEDDAIPDVAIGSAYGPAVYRLYRAGIMGGSDNKGTYFPDRTLSRSEMAANVVRLASYDQRVYNVLLKGNTGAGNTANNWANRGYFAQAGDWIY